MAITILSFVRRRGGLSRCARLLPVAIALARRGPRARPRARPRAGLRTVAIALAAAALGPGGAASAEGASPRHRDGADAQGPLDLAEVVLEQQDVRMSLRIATRGAWTSADLREADGRELCIALVHGEPAVPRGRICVTRRARMSALSYTALAPDGSPGSTRRLAAFVTRPRRGALEASFLPVAAGLSVGRYAWFATSAWTGPGGCEITCADRLPDAGVVDEDLALVSFPACFGAAARDPGRTCQNPDLRLSVEPSLTHAKDILPPYCDRRQRLELLAICSFAAAPGDAAGTFALVGDSHAASLKTALEVVALGKQWRGFSIVRAACPATRGTPLLDTPERSQRCASWNRQVLEWLATHTEIETVFLSSHAGSAVAPAGGEGLFAAAQAGYRDEIGALLNLVQRVVVIRDTPSSAPGHLGCVARALKARRPPGDACTLARSVALAPDPLAAAAVAMGSARVQLIDLSHHYCDDARCFAVVGGALVHRDETHLTPAFSASLGPFILRALGG